MKKSIKIIGLCCVAVIIVIGICMAIPSKTLDFRGTVTKIEIVDNDTIIHLSTTDTSYTVVANNKTNVSYCCKDDPDVDLSDIKVGDVIEGNYRWLSKSNKAKFITVQYHNDGADAHSLKAINTIKGNMNTYYEMSDGTWQMDGHTYKYRLEISGRQPSAVKDTTYVYLSNIEEISFQKAMMASGLSSNTEDYFSVEEAILVEIN